MCDLDLVQGYHAAVRDDFTAFVVSCFAELHGGLPPLFGGHIEVMASRLVDVQNGRIRRLIINVPPRHLKSLIVSVSFAAWVLGHDPSAKIMAISYAQPLADKLARDTRAIMTSSWYQRLFPNTQLVSHALEELITTAGGYRLATSVGGAVTGRGANIIILDDPLKADEAMSDTQRDNVNSWYDSTLVSRLNDQQHGAIVIVMQRLHEDDLVGHVLEQGHWDHLCFPAIAEDDEEHHYTTPSGPATFSRKKGEVLHSERQSLEVLGGLRQTMGSYFFAAQYQQLPMPAGGGLVKVAWFRRYASHELPKFDRVVQSWDTAHKVTELSDYSVCTTWGIKRKKVYLLHVFRKQLEFPDLKRAVRQQQELHSARVVLIEDKASGISLISDLIAEGLRGVTRYEPEGDKVMRMYAQTALIENGFVFLPNEAAWLDDYLHEIAAFPKGRYDDQVDATAQFLDWFKKPMPNGAIFEYYRTQFERKNYPERFRVRLQAPEGTRSTHVGVASGRMLPVNADGTAEMSEQDAQSFIAHLGWKKIDQWYVDEDDK